MLISLLNINLINFFIEAKPCFARVIQGPCFARVIQGKALHSIFPRQRLENINEKNLDHSSLTTRVIEIKQNEQYSAPPRITHFGVIEITIIF